MHRAITPSSVLSSRALGLALLLVFAAASVPCHGAATAEKAIEILSESKSAELQGDYVQLLRSQNGALFVVAASATGEAATVRLYTSTDGTNWSRAGELPEPMAFLASSALAAGFGVNNELIVIYPVGANDGSRELAVFASKDNGATWERRGGLPDDLARQGYVPAGTVTLADGGHTVVAGASDGEILKDATTRLCCAVSKPDGQALLCWSEDGGKTWSVASQIEKASSGISAVFTKGDAWNNAWMAAVEIAGGNRRTDLYRSYNGGLSWRNEATLADAPLGRGDLVHTPDDRLALVYLAEDETGPVLLTRYTDGMKPARSLGGVALRKTLPVKAGLKSKPGFVSTVAMPDGTLLTVLGSKETASTLRWKLPKTGEDAEVTAEVWPGIVKVGEPIKVLASGGAPGSKLALFMQYLVDADEVHPGFKYDPARQLAWMEPNTPSGDFLVSTGGWRPGVHFFTVVDQARYTGRVVDLAVTVQGESHAFETNVLHNGGPIWGESARGGLIMRLPAGLVLAPPYSSDDGGRTWRKDRAAITGRACLLDSGDILVLQGAQKASEAGHYNMRGSRSSDNLKTVETFNGDLYLPQFRPGFAHGHYTAPILHRSVVQLADGTLLATMYGRFEGDDALQVWHGDQRAMKMRSFLVASTNGGKTWGYRSTIGDPADVDTMEGFDETAMVRLPNGELLCVMRSGDNAHWGWNQNNLYLARSSDAGMTWSKPVRLEEEGAAPDLYFMKDGTLVCSFERPGSSLMFSNDNGRTWGSQVNLHAGRYRGYGSICELESGVLLFTHGRQHSVVRVTKAK